MRRSVAPLVLLLLLLPGCAHLGGGRAAEISTDTATRHLLRPLPIPESRAAALERGTRSRSGAPGPRYWQQRVDYRISATLDPGEALLRGRERIVYHNRSPHTLSNLVLNLYQNVFSEGVPRNRHSPITGGIALERVVAMGTELTAVEPREICRSGIAAASCLMAEPREDARPAYAVQGTLSRVVLPRPLASGESVVLEMEWNLRIPPAGTYRTAWEDALGGRAFQVAQWYPQVAVYDDLRGWDATPYLGDGEFYLEYGTFEVDLTLPAGWLVGATGVLQNAEEVLTSEAIRRLAGAEAEDGTVSVVSRADVEAGRATRAGSGPLTWRFRAEDVRDFAFAASDRYVWDVRFARAGGSAGSRRVPVHALYRPGAPGWEEAARYGEHATEFFSDLLIPYLYPQITIAEGRVGGMEYPQIVFIGRPRSAEALYSVIAHEVGHEWFPMMVGQDEAAYAWMDEGLTTAFEDSARTLFFPESDPFGETRASYRAVAGSDAEVPLMRHTDLVSPYGARGVAAYTKPGALMRALRAVVGDSLFDTAMRTYAREWLLRHPTPWDFFGTFERVAGRDLDWFWYPWWFETGVLDYAVESVETADGAVRITLRDLGEVPAPVPVVLTYANGGTARAELPVELWTEDRLRRATLSLPAYLPPVRVEIDPEGLFPDVRPENNVWSAPDPGAPPPG